MLAVWLSPLYIAVNAFTAYWLIRWLTAVHEIFGHWAVASAVLLVYAFLATTLLSSFLIRKDPLHRYLKMISNLWLGFYLYFLSLTVLALVLRCVLRLTPLVHSGIYSRNGFRLVGAVVAVCVLGLFFYGMRHARDLTTVRYPVRVEKTCQVEKLRIALVADLHIGYSVNLSHVRRVVDTINETHADLVVIAGDLFDNEYEAIQHPGLVSKLLAGIRSRYGTYACWGNHDLNEKILAGFTFSPREKRTPDARFTRFLSRAKIHMLEDETVCVADAFCLTGRKDPDRAEKMHETRLDPEALGTGRDASMPWIVIDHQPKELNELEKAGADLVLGGHTHDGQFFPGTIPMGQIWENAHGHLQKGGMHSIVTSGAGVWGPALRVGTDNEVVIVDVTFGG